MRFVRPPREVCLGDVGLVGGKNASPGELIANLQPLGGAVPDGFAVTSEACRHFLRRGSDRSRGLHVTRGIDSISLTPDSVVTTMRRVLEVGEPPR